MMIMQEDVDPVLAELEGDLEIIDWLLNNVEDFETSLHVMAVGVLLEREAQTRQPVRRLSLEN